MSHPTGTTNPTAAVGSLLAAALTGNTGTLNYEGSITSSYGTSGSMVTNMYREDLSDTEPKAFINLMFLSDDITETPVIAYNQIKSASSNAHAQLALPEEFVAPSAGYIVVYLSNESDKLTEVYFDDLLVTVNEHPVIQKADYYPFGMQIAGGYQRMTAKENRWKFTGKERITDLGLNLDDFGARMYDPSLARWNKIDPASEEYFSISPYTYALNTPINAIDPDGKRVYFVAGAGNDQMGWNYTAKWKRAFDNGGIQGFTRLNASHGTAGDIAFTSMYRDNGYSNNMEGRHGVLQERSDLQIDKAVNDIKNDLSNNPLADGEQLNLAGYSYGSVLQAHVALKLAKEGHYIDNLILVGSPISSNSKLFKQLQKNKNIGNVLRIDIEGDKLSDPSSILEFIQGGRQNSDPNDVGEGPHFDLARPGEGEGNQNDTYQRIQKVVIEWLKQQGVE